MNNNISCLDCSSQDIQEIKKTEVVTTEKGLSWWIIVILVVIWPVGIIYLLLRLFGLVGGTDSKRNTKIYYACRSCGVEFR